jgi:hypothetical protein
MVTKSYLHLPAAFPVGIRRNNPGNLVKGKSVAYLGQTTRVDTGRGPLFYCFENMAYGMRAMIQLVLSRITKGGCTTITKLGPKYTNPKVDNTPQWIRDVSSRAKIGPNETLKTDKASIKKLVMAIVQKEVGSPWHKNGVTATIDAQDFEDGWALLEAPSAPPLA